MFESYQKVPEWIRWLLLVPLFFAIMFSFGFIFRMMSVHLAGTFFYDRIFAPLVGGFVLVYVATRLIPRAKLITAFVLCCFWIPLVGLGILSIIEISPSDGGLTTNDLIQGSSALVGSLAAALQAYGKYRKR